MPSRIIKSYGGSENLIDTLISLLVMETIKPSEEIYIVSPWISNIPMIENINNQYSDLFPNIERNMIYFADILTACALRGSKVRIISRFDEDHTRDFYKETKGYFEFKRLKENHEKGVGTQNFYIHGSMNFTYSGIYFNEERIRITTELSEINQFLLSVKSMWEDAEPYESEY